VNGDVETSVAIPRGAVQIYAADDIDAGEAERRRQEKREQLRGEIARAEGKLANEQFVSKAPPDVVQAERDKLAKFKAELEELGE
jgi:valyl-tRNA synthetase